MIGKLKLKDDQPYVMYKVDFDLHPDTIIQEKIIEQIKTYEFLWVDFEVETIAIGNSELDILDKDVAVIKKMYDYDFGTMRESVSVAANRHEKNIYPVGGFAPGYYTNKCFSCKNYFVGDKRAFQCEICAHEESINGVLDLKQKLDSLTEYYSKLLKVTMDKNYRGNIDEELKNIKEEINQIKNKLKDE